MSPFSRKIAAVGATALLSVGVGVSPASAATYTPQSICGSAYKTIETKPVTNVYGTVYGYVYLTYNSSNGYNCVATIKKDWSGVASYTEARLNVQNVGDFENGDINFKYFAGPVYEYAAGHCVSFSGTIYAPDPSVATQGEGGDPNWVHCG